MNALFVRVCAAACLVLAPMLARAADFPAGGPVRIIVSQPPGGAFDLVTRRLAQMLGTAWNGVPVIVDNRTGANGTIATMAVARARPDGRTLLLSGFGLVANKTLFPDSTPYDPIRDFVPIGLVAAVQNAVVVRSDSPIRTLPDLIAAARTRDVTVGTPGMGNSNHMSLLKMQQHTQARFLTVPYRGAGPALIGLVGGDTESAVVAVSGALAEIASGRLRALAVVGKGRSPALPDVPTFTEAGVGFDGEPGWAGILAPAGTPAAIVAEVERQVARIARDPEFVAFLHANGLVPMAYSAREFAEELRDEVRRFPPLLAQAAKEQR